MLVSLFNLVTHRPDLIIDHLAGYLALAQDELNDTKQRLSRRAIAGAIALVFAVAFVVLAGMALMLAGLTTNQGQAVIASPSILIAVPCGVLIAAIVAATIAVKSDSDVSRVSFGDHVQRDIQAFRQVIRAKEENA